MRSRHVGHQGVKKRCLDQHMTNARGKKCKVLGPHQQQKEKKRRGKKDMQAAIEGIQ